jgi:hypothetical protein
MRRASALDVDLMWQRACVNSMLAASPRTDPVDAERMAAAACLVGRIRALPPPLAAAELLVHPTIRPGLKAEPRAAKRRLVREAT